MITGEDEPLSGLNGRLRPRKSNPSSQTNKILRKSDGKISQDKPKRNITLAKASPIKTDVNVKAENATIPQLLCPYCDKKFVSKQTASKHAHRIHLSPLKQDSFIDCLFCNHAESESYSIIRHMVDSHPNQYFACLDCYTRLPSTSDLADHKLNVCERQKLPYRSKLRPKSADGRKNLKSLNSDPKESFSSENKEYPEDHDFNGIVISCELKPSHMHDEADIEDNITTNLILPSTKGISHKAVIEKNAVIVLDDIQWNKRIPSNFSFHNTDADQILSRLGVVHKSPKSGDSKKDWHKINDEVPQKFEKCFDTNFYSKVASNVHENLLKYLDGSFNSNPEPDTTIKTRKSKNCITINTAEGFPILLACEQFSRNIIDGQYMPRAIAPRHKWKWDSPENDKSDVSSDQIKHDPHINNCIITYVSNLDIWTQLSMRRKFEDKFNRPMEKRAEKQNIISKELKEILESREIPTTSQQQQSSIINHANTSVSGDGFGFPLMLGLTPTTRSHDLKPAVLSGEWVRPRCYVCCACGAQTRDPRALSSHISTQHPNAYVQHYEIVGESLLDADILKHLYVPPSQTLNRSRPLRGFRECTKCKKSITLEDLHQHMLDCAGDTPTIRRKCRYRPFGVRKRRPRLPDNRIRKKMRKDMRTGQSNDKNHLRPRPKTKSEVGDAETIRKMLADLPAKRHRVTVNPLNSFPRKKHNRKCNTLMMKKRSFDDQNYINTTEESTTEGSDTFSTFKANDCDFNNVEEDDDDDDLPLKPKIKTAVIRSLRQKQSLNKKATMNRSKRKSTKEVNTPMENSNNAPIDHTSSSQPMELSIDNTPNRVNINGGPNNAREHSNRGGSNNRDNERPGGSRQNGNSNDSAAPAQNVPLKHSIARLTADSETQDKAVQFHRLFLVQQECNNLDQRHLPSDRRLLFENEAVVTKLDKPPLHFNPREASNLQQKRKNKLNKPRKRLNDCIAMLKNKLTPSNDNNMPGHVSVQCGSDEPIEQEPFMIEQDLKIIGPSKELAMNPTILPQASLQELTFKETSTENTDSIRLGNTSPKSSSKRENCSLLYSQDTNDEYKINQENRTDELPLKPAPIKSDSTILSNISIQEVENSQADIAPLPLPRNTVIRKSPKMPVNCANPQEEVRMLKGISNDCTNQNVNNIKSNELPAMILDVTSEINDKSQQLFKNMNDDLIDPSQFSPTKKYNIILTTEVNLEKSLSNSAEELQIDQFIDITPKDDVVDYVSNDFHDTPRTIPPAHASTNVESIISTPLDLSGKKSHTVNTNEGVTFMNNYDSYETLDLSNKGLGADHSTNASQHNNMGPDEVVDLSIKSKFANSIRTVDNELLDNEIVADVSYETINDNLPTDLSLKKNNITSSINLTSQSCENVEFVQDLSSHKTKHREIVQESSLNMEYNVKELPTDLSSNGINDSSLIIEIIDNETNDSSDQDPNEDIEVNISRQLPQNDGYDRTGINALLCDTREIAEPHDNIANDIINLDAQDKMINYTLESTNNNKSVTPILLPSNLSNLNISPCVTNRSEINDTRDMTKSTTTTISQKCEIVKNQHLTTSIDNTILVTQEAIQYDNDNSILKDSNGKDPSLPPYSNNEMLSSQVPVSKIEVSHAVCTPTYTSKSVATADKPGSPNLFTSFPSIPSAPQSSTGTSVNSNINFIDLSLETENSKTPKVLDITEIVDEHYDLTKEEIIDCDLEQDTETAKKIAMLPKELVKILGTMPMDHRKQLLDVLPQYVSPSASLGLGESFTNQRSNISKTRTPSPAKQQAVPIRHGIDEESNKDVTQSNKNSHNETRSQSQPNTCVASSSSILSQDSFPQSVILKTPVAASDINQPISILSNQEHTPIISSELSRSVSVLNLPSKLTFEEVQNMVIDLTDDENIQEIRLDGQIEKNNLPAIKEGSTQNNAVQFLTESPPQKGYSEQTASLRAVRIKTPSERNKKAASDYRIESHCDNNSVKSNDYTSGQNSNLDVQNVDRPRVDVTKVCDDQATHVSITEVYVSPVKESDGTESFEQQSNPSENILSKSSVILTPASLEKNIKVSLGKRYGKRINREISSFSENSTQKTFEENVVTGRDNNNLIATLPSNDNIPCSTTQSKEKTTICDEDSDDDVSLAVIVQQKQREQAQLSSGSHSSSTKNDVAICKKKKKNNAKKVLLKNARNDNETVIGNQTNVDKNIDASLEFNEALVPNASNTQCNVQCVNLDTEENDMFIERRKRKVNNRRDTITSVEFEQPGKIDGTITQVKGNISSKSDLPVAMLQESRTKIINDSFRGTSDSSFDVSSTSIEYGENAEIQAHMNVDVVNRQSFEKTYKRICHTPKVNINLEKSNSYEELRCDKYNKDEDDVRDSVQLNVEATNILNSKFQDLLTFELENCQRIPDNELEGKQTELLDIDFKCKKSNRGKKPKNKNSTDSHKSQPLDAFQAEENSITPLRRSRRGKSMFVDNSVVEPVMSNLNGVEVDKKTPLTKKQLIFSKLLLDEENVTKPSSVIAKNPIVVISNVDLSSHYSSPPQKDKRETQSSLINCTKHIKSSKRRKSPQTKRKSKKLKSFNDICDDSVHKSVALNNNEQKNIPDCEEETHKTVQSCDVDLVRNDVMASAMEQKKDTNSDINQMQYKNILNSEGLVGQKTNNETSTKSITIEKRKISCSLTNAEGNCASTSKKTKLDPTIKSQSKNVDIEKQTTNESCRNSRGRNNSGETRNKTCYNSHVAVRRTRSKSVVVKSSTPLYDPYDIELEDMVEEDAPCGRRIKSSDIALKKISSIRDNEMTKITKTETPVGVNTEPINTDRVIAETSKNIESIEDANDSDDSSKSDVPLKKYVEEKEKKNLELSGSNINESNTAYTSDNLQTDNSDYNKEEKLEDQSGTSQQENNQEQKSEQFMESFGFFSERKQRKSNIIATQKIAETFHASETDEVNEEATEEPAAAESDSKKQEEESVSRDTPPSPSLSPSRRSGKLGRKKLSCSKSLPCYCRICKKEFKRPDNFLRHQMTLFHISKLSEVEMKIKTTPVLEEPNYLIAYKQQLDRLKTLTDKVTKRKKSSKTISKITLPTLDEILATVNKSVRDQQLSRRNLSHDEALFLDCCELLKESHKPDIFAIENVTITSDVNNISTIPLSSDVNDISTTIQAPVAGSSGTKNSAETSESGTDGDVDSITAKSILESEEVRNLENDLISGLKESAANSLAQAANNTDLQSIVPEIKSDQIEEKKAETNLSAPQPRSEHTDCSEKAADEPSTSKSKKHQEAKEKLYPDIVDSIDIFEDKFDKIKRKCRSQAAAAKQVKPVVEPSLSSQRGRKKSEKKRGRGKSSKTMYHYTIPTKGALKVFDGIKVSIPTSEINMSAFPYSVDNTPKKRKRKNAKKRSAKTDIEFKNKQNTDCKAKSTQTQKVDVYEFMDNEDAELFEFRPSTLMERFKNLNNKDTPSTSKHVPCADKTDFSSESGSDGDDFVYDDYVCSDEETENSLMSCELGNGKVGSESKKSSSSLKRKDVVEKSAVMGKIFKHNAVRSEKKCSKIKDQPKPKANLDQLFDSLLEEESGPSTSCIKSPKKEEFMTPKKHESPKKQDSVTPRKYECLTPREPEPSTSKTHEFSPPRKCEPLSPKKRGYSSSRKHETSPRKQEADTLRKSDSRLSRKYDYELIRKHHSTPSKKYECLNLIEDETDQPRKDESVSPRKQETVSCRKHDATSKYNSGKVYPLSSANKKDSDISVKNCDRPSKQLTFDKSLSKKYNSLSCHDVFRTSSKKYDSITYRPSIDEPSTSKMSYDGFHSSKNRESSIDYLPSPLKRHMMLSKRYDYNESFRKYSRDKSLTPELEEDSDSISDCGQDNIDDAASHDTGVARQRARRKCTVGKQNVLIETWSSESDPDGGPARPNSAESVVSPVGRKKKAKRREGQIHSIRRARQMPIKRQDVQARVALFKRSRSRASSGSGECSRASSSGVGTNSTATTSTSAGSIRRPSGSKPRPRSAAYCWSSEGDEEQEHLQQHGWIVGDSHKKLVTMLAHAKGRKRNHDDKRHNVE